MVNTKGMTDWLKNNGLQLTLIAAAALLGWGAINVRVTAIESKVNSYPSQDWFELKFKNIDQSINELEKKIDSHINTTGGVRT
jgi:hypothetical protein